MFTLKKTWFAVRLTAFLLFYIHIPVVKYQKISLTPFHPANKASPPLTPKNNLDQHMGVKKTEIKMNLLKDERLKFLDAGSITNSEIMRLENIFILRVYSVMINVILKF